VQMTDAQIAWLQRNKSMSGSSAASPTSASQVPATPVTSAPAASAAATSAPAMSAPATSSPATSAPAATSPAAGVAGSTLPQSSTPQPVMPKDDSNAPALTPDQKSAAENELSLLVGQSNPILDAALQGAASLFLDPKQCARQVRAIVEAVRDIREADHNTADWTNLLCDALQVTAGKYTDPKKVALEAYKIAKATDKDGRRVRHKEEWKQATLPQPMADDCEPVHGKLSGPKNFALCSAHDHVVDLNKKMVVAHGVAEYTQLLAAGKLSEPTADSTLPQSSTPQPVMPKDDSNAPALTSDQKSTAENELSLLVGQSNPILDAALQGAASLFLDPKQCAKQVRAIVEAVRDIRGADHSTADWTNLLCDALQVTAGKYTDPKKVALEAYKIAKATDKDGRRVRHKEEWKQATLPQPMADDCEPVHGKLSGPKNFALCSAHDHVVDLNKKMVVAHGVAEYTQLLAAGKL
jgi:phage tail protein X